MPYCPDCGNESEFNWYVEQLEERVYSEESDSYETTEVEIIDSYAETCAECGSPALEVG